jgi:hypothetical protein
VWDGIKLFFQLQWDAIKAIFTMTLDAITGALQAAWDGIKAAATLVWDGIKAYFRLWWDAWKLIITTVIDAVTGALQAAWDGIKGAATAVWDALKTAASAAWEGIKTAIMTPIVLAEGLISDTWDRITGTARDIWLGIKQAAATAWDAIKTAVTTPITAAKDLISGIWDTIVTTVTGLPDRIASAASGMWDGIKDAFKSALNWVIDHWNSLKFTLPSIDLGPLGSIGGWTSASRRSPGSTPAASCPAPPARTSAVDPAGGGDRAHHRPGSRHPAPPQRRRRPQVRADERVQRHHRSPQARQGNRPPSRLPAPGGLMAVDYNITFGAVTFGPGTNIQILEVAGLEDLPGLRTSDAELGYAHGQTPGNDYLDGRDITIRFLVLDSGAGDFFNTVEALKAATVVGAAEAQLIFQLPEPRAACVGSGVKVRQRDIPVGANYQYRYGEGTVQFHATDPRIYDAAATSSAIPVFVAGSAGWDATAGAGVDAGWDSHRRRWGERRLGRHRPASPAPASSRCTNAGTVHLPADVFSRRRDVAMVGHQPDHRPGVHDGANPQRRRDVDRRHAGRRDRQTDVADLDLRRAPATGRGSRRAHRSRSSPERTCSASTSPPATRTPRASSRGNPPTLRGEPDGRSWLTEMLRDREPHRLRRRRPGRHRLGGAPPPRRLAAPPGAAPERARHDPEPERVPVRQNTGADMNVVVGSTTTQRDVYVLRGNSAGQGAYIARLDSAGLVVSVPATDPSLPGPLRRVPVHRRRRLRRRRLTRVRRDHVPARHPERITDHAGGVGRVVSVRAAVGVPTPRGGHRESRTSSSTRPPRSTVESPPICSRRTPSKTQCSSERS